MNDVGHVSIHRYTMRTVDRCHNCGKPVYEGKIVHEYTYHGLSADQRVSPYYTSRLWHQECYEEAK